LYDNVNKYVDRFIKIQRVSSSSNLVEEETSNVNNDDTEDDEDEAMENILPKKRKSQPPYTLRLVDSYGLSDEYTLEDDDKPLPGLLKDRITLGLIWSSQNFDTYYDETKEKDIEQHESCLTNVEKEESDTVDLATCVNLFTEEEQLGPEDTWYCSNCKDHVQAFKKFDLWRLPPMLVIHLKRFSYKKKYWREKLETFVDYPVHDLDLSELAKGPQAKPPVYELYAVSNHYGSLGGGHYTAYAKNYKDSKWYKYDDSTVSRMDEEKARTSSAYVLFYRRKDTLVPTTETTEAPVEQMDTENNNNVEERTPSEDKMEEVAL
jgi:hypothetical protein